MFYNNYCNEPCRLCNRKIISNSVTIITVGGTDTLVIDIPASTYRDCEQYCIVIAQAIPAVATINMPVAISIGGVTTIVYPLTTRCCTQVVACQIRTRTRYKVCVSTTATGGTFRVLDKLHCAPNNALASLPSIVAAAVTPATSNVATIQPVATSTQAVSRKATAKPTATDSVIISANNVTVNKEAK